MKPLDIGLALGTGTLPFSRRGRRHFGTLCVAGAILAIVMIGTRAIFMGSRYADKRGEAVTDLLCR